jgi:Protein ENHANCED DISEASE RESISTANCE 2, C-terminal
MEVDIDVASSSVARHVVGLVSGASKSVVVDMGILLQVGRGSGFYMAAMVCAACHAPQTAAWSADLVKHIVPSTFALRGASVSCATHSAPCLPSAQGNARDELPESLLGTMRLCNVRSRCATAPPCCISLSVLTSAHTELHCTCELLIFHHHPNALCLVHCRST